MKSYNPDDWSIALRRSTWKDTYIPKKLRKKFNIKMDERGVIIVTPKKHKRNK
jgi:hypothetical protein